MNQVNLDRYNITMSDLTSVAPLSPIVGLDVVTTRQVMEYFGIPSHVFQRARQRAKAQLDQLGLFTMAARGAGERVPGASRTESLGYALPLEDGGTTEVPCGRCTYFPAPAVARLAVELVDESEVAKRILEMITPSTTGTALAVCSEEPSQVVDELRPIEYQGKRVITTELLAKVYGTYTNNIKKNFSRNKRHFIDGLHFYLLQGKELREFKYEVKSCDIISKNVNKLYLWTERGVNKHCKILNTDKAWEQFDHLCSDYFYKSDTNALSTAQAGSDDSALFNVNFDGEYPTVSSRDLYAFLDVETPYYKWFPRMCEYGFTENQDFVVTDIFVCNPSGGPRNISDAMLTIDMAKEICMLQRTEKGKMARQYFLRLEKVWNSPEHVMARALKLAEKETQTLKLQAANNRPKVEFADAVGQSKRSISVGDFSKLLYDKCGINMGRNQMFNWMREQKILQSNNIPYQKYIAAGYFEVAEFLKYGRPIKTTLVTGAGQLFLHKLLAGKKV